MVRDAILLIAFYAMQLTHIISYDNMPDAPCSQHVDPCTAPVDYGSSQSADQHFAIVLYIVRRYRALCTQTLLSSVGTWYVWYVVYHDYCCTYVRVSVKGDAYLRQSSLWAGRSCPTKLSNTSSCRASSSKFMLASSGLACPFSTYCSSAWRSKVSRLALGKSSMMEVMLIRPL